MQIAINLLHRYIPIRPFLPFKANKTFVHATETTRKILREHIQRRRKDYWDGKVSGEKAGRDLLTLMIEESRDTMSEDETLGFVSHSQLKISRSFGTNLF